MDLDKNVLVGIKVTYDNDLLTFIEFTVQDERKQQTPQSFGKESQCEESKI